MKLPLRARITAWYFAGFGCRFCIICLDQRCGLSAQHRNDREYASRANLKSVQRILVRVAPKEWRK